MKIGFFDSGLGGLVIMNAVRRHMPQYDMVYLGDTLHVPYGGRSLDAIYNLTKQAIDYLFRVQDCALIIVACNTASAAALRRIQQDYLVKNFPDRRVLGVVVPTLEAALASGHNHIGVLATKFVAQSGIYAEELQKLNPNADIREKACPLLVPLIENQGEQWLDSVLEHYLADFMNDTPDALILGCTHYPLLRDRITHILGDHVKILSQADIIPPSLQNYLHRHPEMDARLDKNSHITLLTTDTPSGDSVFLTGLTSLRDVGFSPVTLA